MGEAILARATGGGGDIFPVVVVTKGTSSFSSGMGTFMFSVDPSNYVNLSNGASRSDTYRPGGSDLKFNTYDVTSVVISYKMYVRSTCLNVLFCLTADKPEATAEPIDGFTVTAKLVHGYWNGNDLWGIECTKVNNTGSSAEFYHDQPCLCAVNAVAR